jgi:hypothetical protein
MSNRLGAERRRYPRVHVSDMTAVVLSRLHSAVCVVHELSAGGARIRGQIALVYDESIEITFELYRAPMTAFANVVRIEDDGFAIKFREVTPAMHHAIQRLVLETLQRSRPKP